VILEQTHFLLLSDEQKKGIILKCK